MRKILLFLLSFLTSSLAMAESRESFFEAWEAVQKQHTEVTAFEKIAEDHYRISFANLPFDGELKVLAYGTDRLHYNNDTDISLMGYVEVELQDAPEDMIEKYYRTYGHWSESLSLFYHQKQGQWLTSS